MSDKEDDNQGKPKLVFTEGCFDGFDGTQEELDEIVAQITQAFETGELIENAIEIDGFDGIEDVEDEVLELLPQLVHQGNIRH